MTITNTQVTTEIEVEKVWNDNNDAFGIRPTKLTVELKADGESLSPAATYELNESESWKHTWTSLPKYHTGTDTEIEYSVVETVPTGYKETYVPDGGVAGADGKVKIKNTPETTERIVEKVWADEDDRFGIRPASIEIVLTGSDGKTYAVTLDGTVDTTVPTGAGGYESATWTAKFINLPKYWDNGTAVVEVTYTADETAVPTGYKVSYSADDKTVDATTGLTITNTPETVERIVKKEWADEDDRYGNRPASIEIALMGSDGNTYTVTLDGAADEVPTGTASVGYEDSEWTATFINLPKYWDDGTDVVEVTYTADETTVPTGYTVSYSADDQTVDATDGLTITNTTELTTITVKKFWKDNNDSQGKRSGVKAEFYLRKTVDGVSMEIRTVTVGKDQNWTHTWEDLPVYENGKAITYSVREVLAKSNGYTCDTTDWKVVTNGGTIKITNTLKDDTPGTGDNTKILLWAGLTLMSAVGCGGALVVASRRKRKETEQ